MSSKCSFCNSYQEIVYQDETISGKPKIYIDVCWACFIDFKIRTNFSQEQLRQTPTLKLFIQARELIEEIKKRMKNCSKCKEDFLPKYEWGNVCLSCYKQAVANKKLEKLNKEKAILSEYSNYSSDSKEGEWKQISLN